MRIVKIQRVVQSARILPIHVKEGVIRGKSTSFYILVSGRPRSRELRDLVSFQLDKTGPRSIVSSYVSVSWITNRKASMDDDEGVIFEHSVLHEHLRAAGFTDEDIATESISTVLKHATSEKIKFGKEKERTNQHSLDPKRWAQDLWYWLKGGDSMAEEIKNMHWKHGDQIVEEVLQSPVLEVDDGLFLEGYWKSCLNERTEEEKEGLDISVFMQLGVLAGALAYGAFRMLFLKPQNFIDFVHGIDALSFVLIVSTLMPSTVRYTTGGKVLNSLTQFKKDAVSNQEKIEKFYRLTRKSLKLIQEIELINKGFTMTCSGISMSQIDKNITDVFQRLCPHLRLTLFHSCRNMMVAYKKATASLLHIYPKNVELEDMSSYLANQPLEEYGPVILLEDGKQLQEFTEGYSLASLKTLLHLCNTHCSEFLRVFAIALLVKADDGECTFGFRDVLDVCKQDLLEPLTEQYRKLEKVYILQKHLEQNQELSQQKAEKTTTSSVFTALHSLSLHLLVALQRTQDLEERVEKWSEKSETDQWKIDSHQEHVLSQLEITKRNLDASMDCWEETLGRSHKLFGTADKKQQPESSPEANATQTLEENKVERKPPVALFEMSDPVIEDQVFEDYSDPLETIQADYDSLLSDDDRERKRIERGEARRMLKELRSVISTRAIQSNKREVAAWYRMYPDRPLPLDLLQQSEETTPKVSQENNVLTGQKDSDSNIVKQGCDLTVLTQDNTKQVSKDNEERPSNVSHEGTEITTFSTIGSNENNLDDHMTSERTNLKERLDLLHGGFPFAGNIAALAVARSHQMVNLSEDTYGDDGSMSEEEA